MPGLGRAQQSAFPNQDPIHWNKSAAQLPHKPGWLKPLGCSKTSQWRLILIPYNCLFPPFFSSITSDIAHLCSPELQANSWREHGSHCRQADGEKPAIASALSADYFHWQLADAEHLLASQKLRSLLFQLAIQTQIYELRSSTNFQARKATGKPRFSWFPFLWMCKLASRTNLMLL